MTLTTSQRLRAIAAVSPAGVLLELTAAQALDLAKLIEWAEALAGYDDDESRAKIAGLERIAERYASEARRARLAMIWAIWAAAAVISAVAWWAL